MVTSTGKSRNGRGEDWEISVLPEPCESPIYSTRAYEVSSLESVKLVRNEHFRIAV